MKAKGLTYLKEFYKGQGSLPAPELSTKGPTGLWSLETLNP